MWPGLLAVLQNPSLIPGQVWTSLYVTSIAAGTIAGYVDRKGIVDYVLRSVGIDLRLHGDLWGRLFKESSYVQVYLNDGNLLFGWPQYYSSDRSQPGPELYLTQVQIWDSEQSAWVEMKDVAGVLLDASQISRIEFMAVITENENSEIVR